jgi:hypothetical protein
MDTWDVTIGDGPVHKAKTVDDAIACCPAAGRERGKEVAIRGRKAVAKRPMKCCQLTLSSQIQCCLRVR